MLSNYLGLLNLLTFLKDWQKLCPVIGVLLTSWIGFTFATQGFEDSQAYYQRGEFLLEMILVLWEFEFCCCCCCLFFFLTENFHLIFKIPEYSGSPTVCFTDPNIMKKLQVDRGAIKFVLAGANIMCPGLTSPGGFLDEEVGAETPVV